MYIINSVSFVGYSSKERSSKLVLMFTVFFVAYSLVNTPFY